jgi:pyrroloquinoline quinone biosynthesis protein B
MCCLFQISNELKKWWVLVLAFTLVSCNNSTNQTSTVKKAQTSFPKLTGPYIMILGTTQDAGSPQAGCKKDCCKNLFLSNDKSREVVSLGLIDPINKKTYLFEATPDMPHQLKRMHAMAGFEHAETPDAIFLTHAHIGHYTGLMYLGKESMNADSVPVYTMPRMKTFLEENGPWSQLVKKGNIAINEIAEYISKKVSFGFIVKLDPQIRVDALQVPHRDEFSETVGYIISGPTKKVLFIPDIDKWSKWELNITELVSQVDYAFLDGTFYDGEEIKARNIDEIPHPFVIESMELFKHLSPKEKAKIHFIHFNHTNKLLDSTSHEYKTVIKNGFKVAQLNDIIQL